MRTVKLGRKEVTVPWTITDRLVEWINPAAGMERLKGRVMMAEVGGYAGGKRDRRATRNWRPKQTSVNEDLAHDLPDLRTRSRDLSRNVPIATGAINTVVTSVVGDGLVLQSQIDQEALGLTPEQAEDWQRQAEREFAIWARRPDFTSRLNFDEMQALVLRAVLESGDILVVRRRRADAQDTYGLKLQLVEADRLSNPNHQQNTPTMVEGVELDADGVPVAYHIATRHPDDVGRGASREWRRFSAGSSVTGQPLILHLYPQLRPDQARGIPWLSPVTDTIKQLGDYAEAEVRAAVISAMFTVFVKPASLEGEGDAPLIGSNDPSSNVDARSEIQLGNGAIVDLGQGEDVTFADPKRPNTAFDGFVTAMSRHIGVALELPYELLLKSFTASYSASRAALEMAWQMFRTRRSWLAWKFCQPVYEWVITEAVASGRLSAPGFFDDPIIREAWLGSDWIGPSRIQLDPQKEAAADLLDLNMQVTTRQQIIMERKGGSFEQKYQQLVREKKMLDAAGLVTAGSASEALQPPPSRQNGGVDDSTDDGGDNGKGNMQSTNRAFELMAQASLVQAEASRLQAEKPPANIHLPEINIASMRLDPGSIPAPVVHVAAPVVNVAPAAVHIEPPVVNVAAPIVKVQQPKAKTQETILQFGDGRTARMIKKDV